MVYLYAIGRGALLISEILIHGEKCILELKKCGIMVQCKCITVKIKLKMKVLLMVNQEYHLSKQMTAHFYFYFHLMLISNTFTLSKHQTGIKVYIVEILTPTLSRIHLVPIPNPTRGHQYQQFLVQPSRGLFLMKDSVYFVIVCFYTNNKILYTFSSNLIFSFNVS